MVIGVVARAAGAALVVLLAAAHAFAATESFYSGKTLTIIAGYRPGGGVDACARTIARHLARHLPGAPKTAVSNLAGGTGTAAANFLYEKAAPDGLTLAVPGRTWVLSRVLHEPSARFDPLRFAYIGSPGPSNYKLWVRRDLGIRTADDLRRLRRELVIGALSLRTTNGSIPLILSRDGLPIRVLPGYAGTPHILEAIARREIDGIFSADDTLRAGPGALIERGTVIPVLQTLPELPGLPLLDKVVSAKSRPLYELAMATERFGMPLIGPPGMAHERVAVLRAAFRATMADPRYLADARRLGRSPGTAIAGETLEKMVSATITAATPEAVRQYTDYTRSIRPPASK